ncbi:hypothetical protein PR048_009595, partial [Dryococelus australis]
MRQTATPVFAESLLFTDKATFEDSIANFHNTRQEFLANVLPQLLEDMPLEVRVKPFRVSLEYS